MEAVNAIAGLVFTLDDPMHPFAFGVTVRTSRDGSVASVGGSTLTAALAMKTASLEVCTRLTERFAPGGAVANLARASRQPESAREASNTSAGGTPCTISCAT